MKEFFKAIGKAALYFIVYLSTQSCVSTVFSFVYSMKAGMEAAKQNTQIDTTALYNQIYEKVMTQATLIMLIAGVLALLAYWILFLIRKKSFRQEAYIGKMDIRGVIPVFLFGVTFNMVISVAMERIPFPASWIESYQKSSTALVSGYMAVNLLATILMAPILEEVVFRGLMYTRLRRGMPKLLAAVIVSGAFAIMHGTIIWGIYTFIFSMLLVWTFERFHSLKANILFHMSFNLVGMVLPLTMPKTTAAQDMIIGLAAAIVMALVIWWIYRMTAESSDTQPASQQP